ncbi:IS200/IS605 family transposase [Candidatus Margulisiibacteriota bacterium]
MVLIEEEIKEGLQCSFLINYHLAFPIKNKKTLENSQIKDQIKNIINTTAQNHNLRPRKIGYDANHIHLLCSAHPKYPPKKLVREFKKKVVQELQQAIPNLQTELPEEDLFDKGFSIASYTKQGDCNVLENYLQNNWQNINDLNFSIL